MGLFDLLKRKHPDDEPPTEFQDEPASDDSPPSLHYFFAHYALRQLALNDPLPVVFMFPKPEGKEVTEKILQSLQEDLKAKPTFSADDVKYHPLRVLDHPCLVTEMPAPNEVAEAIYTATVLLISLDDDKPDLENAKSRYFTLEKGATLTGETRTVFCEWQGDTHANFGDGPDPTIGSFVHAIEAKLMNEATDS